QYLSPESERQSPATSNESNGAARSQQLIGNKWLNGFSAQNSGGLLEFTISGAHRLRIASEGHHELTLSQHSGAVVQHSAGDDGVAERQGAVMRGPMELVGPTGSSGLSGNLAALFLGQGGSAGLPALGRQRG